MKPVSRVARPHARRSQCREIVCGLFFTSLPERVRVWGINRKLGRTSRTWWFWVGVLWHPTPLSYSPEDGSRPRPCLCS